jgi:hypothetical protein
VLWLLGELGLDRPDVLPVYIGDDETDEDAFAALAGRGIGILVADRAQDHPCRYRLESPDAVGRVPAPVSSTSFAETGAQVGAMTDIVTLTMNPAVDLSTSVDKVVAVHKLRCSPARRDPGGGGINVARVATRLGADVKALYPRGGETGALLRRLIDGEGIASLAVHVAGETREDITVLEEDTGEQFRFVFPGPKLSEAEWRNA